MKQTLSTVVMLSLLMGNIGVSYADTIFNLDFNQNSSLPSAQGLTYQGNVSESTAYSVSNGLLHLNTVQFASDVYSYYESSGGYDRTLLNTQLAAKVYVQQAPNFGIAFTYYDSTGLVNQTTYGQFIVTHTGWSLPGTSFAGTFVDPSAFHVLDLQSSATTNTFTFRVDGVVVASGARALEAGSFGSDVYFGDGTPTGGNVIADIAYVHYRNTDQALTSTVPEPSSIALLSFGALVMALAAARRKLY